MIESLAGIGMIMIVVLAAGVVFSDYWATSGALKKDSQSNDMTVLIMSDIFESPWVQVEKLCTDKAAWSGRKSSCDTVDLRAPASTALQVSTEESTVPKYSSLLGKNLIGYGSNGGISPSCVDLVRCQRVISNSLIELTFSYQYLPSKGKEKQERFFALRRGPW